MSNYMDRYLDWLESTTPEERLAEAERIRRCGPLSECARNGHADRRPGEALKDHVWKEE